MRTDHNLKNFLKQYQADIPSEETKRNEWIRLSQKIENEHLKKKNFLFSFFSIAITAVAVFIVSNQYLKHSANLTEQEKIEAGMYLEESLSYLDDSSNENSNNNEDLYDFYSL